MQNVELYLDVSSKNTGVCLLDVDTQQIELTSLNLQSLLKPSQMPQVDFQKIKIGLIKQQLDRLLEGLNVVAVYIEGIFIQPKFLKSSEFLLKIHGFLMGYFADVPLYFFPPKVIKKYIAGSGNANKEDIQEALIKHYKIESFPDSDHSDAFALCVYHHQWKNFEEIRIRKDNLYEN